MEEIGLLRNGQPLMRGSPNPYPGVSQLVSARPAHQMPRAPALLLLGLLTLTLTEQPMGRLQPTRHADTAESGRVGPQLPPGEPPLRRRGRSLLNVSTRRPCLPPLPVVPPLPASPRPHIALHLDSTAGVRSVHQPPPTTRERREDDVATQRRVGDVGLSVQMSMIY
jgi:hypothetical protein